MNPFQATLGKLEGHMLMDRLPVVLDLEKSHGSWLHDGLTGEDFLDGFTGFASLPLGWNHPGLREEAFLQKLLSAAVDKPALSDLYVPAMADFVETFCRVAIPAELPYLFLISGGALAVENALKTAFDWKTRKNRAAGRSEKGDIIIHFRRAFHGRTGYTMSLTDSPDPRKTRDFPLWDWPRVENPHIRFPRTPEGDAETLAAEQRALAQIEGVLAQRGARVAGLIIEPIQGEGGDHHFRPEFLAALRRLADEHDFLLIFDEVQAGMGITGEWWSHQTTGVSPDVMCFGKKSQVCGMAASRRLDEVEGHVFAESSRLNSTWGGNLVDMVRCQRIIEIIEEDGLLAEVRRLGGKLLAGLEQLEADFPAVSGARGRGYFAALDFPDAATRNAVVEAAAKERLLVLGCGDRSLRLRLSLALTEDELDTLLTRLRAALTRALG